MSAKLPVSNVKLWGASSGAFWFGIGEASVGESLTLATVSVKSPKTLAAALWE